jgi:hypothetical protein
MPYDDPYRHILAALAPPSIYQNMTAVDAKRILNIVNNREIVSGEQIMLAQNIKRYEWVNSMYKASEIVRDRTPYVP